MGLFSWLTSDTEESIRVGEKRTVYCILPNGESLEEKCYEGYGVFGGVDVHMLLYFLNAWSGVVTIDQMREVHKSRVAVNGLRSLGIGMDCSPHEPLFPLKFSHDKNAKYSEIPAAKRCPHQGFFFPDDDGDLD